MATITPLLDTLLHEVLGRRMDAPSKSALTPPVNPVFAAKAAQVVRGDPRLEAGGKSTVIQDGTTLGKRASQPISGATTDGPGASSYTRLSPAANLISAVLARFPAPPSVIRSPQMLLPSAALLMANGPDGNGQQQGSQLLQEGLRSSIGDSGLFYESHLRAWFRGALPLERLLRQPQMQGAVVGEAFSGSVSTPGSPTAPLKGQLPASAPIAAKDASDTRADLARPALSVADLTETVQTLLRHQLELLVVPVLRWEGEVWPGLFMALTLELPEYEADGAPDGENKEDESAEECRAELQLTLEDWGVLQARLHLRAERLSLSIETPSPELHALLESGREALLDRLNVDGLVAELHFAFKEADGEQGA